MKYQIGLYESPTGALVADHTALITQLQWATDTGGDKDLTYTALIAPRDAMALFDRRDILHVQVSRGGEVLWQGRVTGAGVSVESATSVRIQALGYRTAMYDTLFSAIYRDDTFDNWQFRDGGSGERADLYSRIQSQDSIGLSMQARRYTTSTRGRLQLSVENPNIPLEAFDAVVNLDIPTGFNLRTSYANNPTASFASETVIDTLSGPYSGDYNISWNGLPSDNVQALRIGLVPTTNVTVSSTDDYYFRLTFSTVSAIFNLTMVADIIQSINAINSDSLSFSSQQTFGQFPNALFPQVMVYRDQRPGDVMDHLISAGEFGTNASFVWGVDQRRVLYVRRAIDIVTTWQIEVAGLTLDRVNTTIYNQGYGVATNNSGAVVRTSTFSVQESITQLGLTRQLAIPVRAATDTDIVQTIIANAATPIPQIAIVPSLVTFLGQIVEPYRVRAGDAVQLLSMPFIGVDGLARLRTFRVVETRYDAIADRIELTPESAPPRLQDVVRP